MNVARVRNESVWKSIKIAFLASALLFLVNILFGFDNSFSVGEIPRYQLLIHLHAGSIGWITLSAIGLAVWLHTGNRVVSGSYEGRVRLLVWAAIVAFGGYIPNFWIAFSRGQGQLLALLPIFGAASVLVLWAAAVYAISQLGKGEVLTTPQLLVTGGLLVAAIGSTVGMLLGLERVIGQFLSLPPGDRVGAHAGMMDTYLFLVAGAIIEWFAGKQPGSRWSVAGLLQALFWTVGATLVPIAFFLNLVPTLLPIFVLLLLIGLIIFIVRVGWRPIARGPFGEPAQSWMFFGSIWLVVFMGLFLFFVANMEQGVPAWFGTAFVHVGYVGMMTNVLLAVLAARSSEARDVLPWGEPTALWLLNVGMVIFVGLKVAMDVRWAAILMGLGVLLGVVTMISRLLSLDGTPPVEPAAAPPGAAG